MADFWKYHGLGNDYLVMEPERFTLNLTPAMIRLICDRHLGIGADGILVGPSWETDPEEPGKKRLALRIFNPDGSEGEKSGNGLRIFARYLWENGYAKERIFAISTKGGLVEAEILEDSGGRIAIEMGQVSFKSQDIPIKGAPREALMENLLVNGEEFAINGATVGNPHCVLVVDDPTPEMARDIGPQIENHPVFPNRTNVQFMKVLNRNRIQIEIWERGAGYTLSSGTSSCASAAVAVRLGHCESPVTVLTPGGELTVEIDDKFNVRLEGGVVAVGFGTFSAEMLESLGLERKKEAEK